MADGQRIEHQLDPAGHHAVEGEDAAAVGKVDDIDTGMEAQRLARDMVARADYRQGQQGPAWSQPLNSSIPDRASIYSDYKK